MTKVDIGALFKPFMGAIATCVAIVFGIGVIGLIVLLLRILGRYFAGGRIGRSYATMGLIEITEYFAIIPAIFIILNAVKAAYPEPHVAGVVNLLNNLLEKGWKNILGILG